MKLGEVTWEIVSKEEFQYPSVKRRNQQWQLRCSSFICLLLWITYYMPALY